MMIRLHLKSIDTLTRLCHQISLRANASIEFLHKEMIIDLNFINTYLQLRYRATLAITISGRIFRRRARAVEMNFSYLWCEVIDSYII